MLSWILFRFISIFIIGFGDQADRTTNFRATLQVIADEDSKGSAIILSVSSGWSAPAVANWQLCFTWLKAVVLRQPQDALVSGSYVCLPRHEPLEPGGVHAFVIEIGAPAMRYVSDLPRALHIVMREESLEAEAVFEVELITPGEAQVRLSSDATSPPTFSGVPQPQSVTRLPGPGFDLMAGLQPPLQIQSDEETRGAAALLHRWLLNWPPGAPFGVPDGVAARETRNLSLTLIEDADLESEGYEVRVQSNAINIAAPTPSGLLHGVATLRQLLGVALADGLISVPAQLIRDKPRFSHRGLMLDVGRHFFSVDFILRLLDWMFLYKLNTFHWHLTDDEGWRFEVRSLPNLTLYGSWRGRGEVIEPQYAGGPRRYGGFYSHSQIRDVVQYAKERGIRIIPEIDVPGHCYAAIKALPELLGRSVERQRKPKPVSVQGFRGNVLNPVAAETYEFLEAVLKEVVELFPGPIHVGMDEIPRGAWSENVQEEEEIKAGLTLWLQTFLAKHGRSMMAWEEAFTPGTAIDPDTEQRPAAFAWKEDERFAVRAANAGLDVVLCPAHFLYLDIVQSLSYEERGLYWAAPALPLQRVYDYEPIERLRRMGLEESALRRVRGLQANLWTETVDSEARAEEMLFPRLLAVAEVAWTEPTHRVWENFKWKLGPQLQWLSRQEKLEHWNQFCGQVARGDFLRVAPRI